MVFGDDDQTPYEILCSCCLQVFHPHVEDYRAHLEDDQPLHPLQGISLKVAYATRCRDFLIPGYRAASAELPPEQK
jgi:hypothetical protein